MMMMMMMMMAIMTMYHDDNNTRATKNLSTLSTRGTTAVKDSCGELRLEMITGDFDGVHDDDENYHDNFDDDHNNWIILVILVILLNRFSTLEGCVAACGGEEPQERAECHQVILS